MEKTYRKSSSEPPSTASGHAQASRRDAPLEAPASLSLAAKSGCRKRDATPPERGEPDSRLVKGDGTCPIEPKTQLVATTAALQLPTRVAVRRAQNANTCTAVRPYLLLGDAQIASDLYQLRHLGVTHILNLTWERENSFGNQFIYMHLRTRDNLAQHLRGHFEAIVAFIEGAHANPGAKVLVHCSEGVSRSVTAVLAWLMYAEKKQLGDAFAELKQLRPIAEPNPSFLRQLRQYEIDLGLPLRTLQKLTPLDEGGQGPQEPRHLQLLRSIVSKAATEGIEALTREEEASFCEAFVEIAPPQQQAAYQTMVTVTFHAFGGRLDRDEAARHALAQLSRALLASSSLANRQLTKALALLPSTEVWQALDLPLGAKFLQDLRQRIYLTTRDAASEQF